jgi:hypothetical protein
LKRLAGVGVTEGSPSLILIPRDIREQDGAIAQDVVVEDVSAGCWRGGS